MRYPLAASPLIALALAVAVPAVAQTPAAPAATVGATVYDASGGVVGTIDSVTADAYVVSTGTNKVGVPKASFAAGPKGPVMAMTKVQLDAAAADAAAKASAALSASLVPAATVYDSSGTKVGTIKEADAQFVTVTTAKGDAKLPRNAFAAGAQGPAIGMTAAALEAAVAAAKPGASK